MSDTPETRVTDALFGDMVDQYTITIRFIAGDTVRAEIVSVDADGQTQTTRTVMPKDGEHDAFLLTGRDGPRTRDRGRSYPTNEYALRAAINAAGHQIGTDWASFVKGYQQAEAIEKAQP